MKEHADLLRSHGLRVTAQRTALLGLLREVDGHQHLTAKELYEMAAPTMPGLNLATVYRTLEGLHEAGLVDRLKAALDQIHYSFRDPAHLHGHLCCRQCGKVEECDYDLILNLAKNVRAAYGFQIDREHLSLAGLCADCASVKN
ncbi:MAG: transcriptional repressor [Candidatus Eremiobacteraeota bacterium]|nr:transcriptional repressor [Candidatus Eremiobacteraeota bacterium]